MSVGGVAPDLLFISGGAIDGRDPKTELLPACLSRRRKWRSSGALGTSRPTLSRSEKLPKVP